MFILKVLYKVGEETCLSGKNLSKFLKCALCHFFKSLKGFHCVSIAFYGNSIKFGLNKISEYRYAPIKTGHQFIYSKNNDYRSISIPCFTFYLLLHPLYGLMDSHNHNY